VNQAYRYRSSVLAPLFMTSACAHGNPGSGYCDEALSAQPMGGYPDAASVHR